MQVLQILSWSNLVGHSTQIESIYRYCLDPLVEDLLVGSLDPTMVAGDPWINNDQNQLYFFDGTDLELAGPIYNAFQGRSGPQVVTVLDNTGTSRTIVKYWVGGNSVGLWSKIAALEH